MLSFIIGAVLRLYLISSQILIDDEWHGLNYVIGRSFLYVFTNHGEGANSIPLNLYCWFLLKTFGWSELLLRAPSMIAGILSIVVFPVFVMRMFNTRTAVIFSFLLAISPVMIFYSRMYRPYGIVVFFSFISFFSLLLWVKSGERKLAVLYICTAVLAVYFHLYASIAVLTPLGIVFLFKIFQRAANNNKDQIVVMASAKALIGVGVTIFFLLSILLLPAHIQNLWWQTRLGFGSMNLKTITGYLSILSGTSNFVMVGIFLFFFISGLWSLFRKKNIFSVILATIIVIYFTVMIRSHQLGIHAAIQVARYSISLFPLALIVVAYGMDRILCYLYSMIKTSRQSLILIDFVVIFFLVSLFFSGPLLETYQSPNNFTNHSAFQDSYKPHTWERSRPNDLDPGITMSKKSVPDFYHYLSQLSNVKAIIEYPIFLGDLCNLYYYYQRFHRKKIIAGFLSNAAPLQRAQDYIVGDFYVDYVISRLTDLQKVRFTNMINMESIEAIKNSSAQFIVLHKHLKAEMVPYLTGTEKKVKTDNSVLFLDQLYRKLIGKPFFEDQNIILYKMP
ncbi:glycosyltransferase family 39 protein [Thermodesulfobacteriota bacterium]